MSTGAEPRRYDLALIANICHLFGENANLQLLRRVADALRPAGRVAIVDILATERGDGPRPAVLYARGSCCAPAAAASIPIRPSYPGSAKEASGIPAGAISPARFRSP
jgi:O-methyltransferase domain